MKYLFLFTVLLFGCSTPRIQESLAEYECTIFGGHGTYGRMTGSFQSEKAAEESAEKIRLYFVKKGWAPEESSVFCSETGAQ